MPMDIRLAYVEDSGRWPGELYGGLPGMAVRFLAFLALLFCNQAFAVETLRVLAWPGYASSETIQSFEAHHNVIVEVTVVGSDDELWKYGSADEGANFDVIALNTVELQR